jgi:4-cresol dehydrogenase (hydroxylating)
VTPHTDHFGAATSFEVVLPSGKIYRSALTDLGGTAVDRAFKWGIGPYLDGLFTQSNLGIVTEMTIALAPRPQCVTGFLISLESDTLIGKAVKAIRDTLSADKGFIGAINLMNDRRVLSMTSSYPREAVPAKEAMSADLTGRLCKQAGIGAWTIGGVIYGDRQMTRLTKRRIKSRFKPFAQRVLFFTSGKIDLTAKILRFVPGCRAASLRKQIASLREAFKVAHGIPTEIALQLCYWKNGRRPPEGRPLDPARDGCGAIWYSPLVPMKPAQVTEYVRLVEEHCIAHGMEPLVTLTSLSARCFDSTVPLLFDPANASETKRAKNCYQALFQAGRESGFVPYRIGIGQMELVTGDANSCWNLVRKIKQAVDPQGIIAPGRYCPPGP